MSNDIVEDHVTEHVQVGRPVTRSFIEFLLPAIHTILYLREVYPATSFLNCQAYGLSLYQSRHPAVCAWINHAVDALEQELAKGTIHRVALVLIHPQTLQPLERYMWDVACWPNEASSEYESSNEPEELAESDEDLADDADRIEQLRTLLSRLLLCKERLHPILPGCTYTIVIELKDDCEAPPTDIQSWITSETAQYSKQREEISQDCKDQNHDEDPRNDVTSESRTIVLPGIESGKLMFDMWIEEQVTNLTLQSKNK